MKSKRELERKISEMNESHLTDSQNLLSENQKLLKKIQDLQHNQNGDENANEKLSMELQIKIEELNRACKEIAVLQSQVNENKDLKSLLMKEKQCCADLRQELSGVVVQLQRHQKDATDLRNENKNFSEMLSEKEKTLSELYRDIQKERVVHQQMISDSKLKDDEQIARYHSRISSLEAQISKQSGEYISEIKTLKDKVKQYGALIKKLRFRLESAKVKEQELEARLEALKQDFVPSHLYRSLQQHFQKFLNKHSEFKAFIQGFENKRDSLNQVEELSRRISSINDKFVELERVQTEAYSALEAM